MAIAKKRSKIYLISFTAFLSILFIGYLDYLAGYEISFFILYLIPIVLIALNENCKSAIIVILAVIAAIVWHFTSIMTDEIFSSMVIFYWDTFVRLLIFTAVGLLAFTMKKTKRQLLEIKKLNEEKNKFLGIAAHDIRSPVSGIFGLSELILNDPDGYPLNPESKKIIEFIRQTSQSSLILLNNYLDFSKIEAGKLDMEMKQNDYLNFIKNSVVINNVFAQKKNIEIMIEPEITTLHLKFDEHYLMEVINNLLMNAIKFSYPNSKIKIHISVADNFVKTEVIDTGVGILEEEHSKLFDFFTKTSSQSTGGERGSGIGLAIAKKIVLLHNGEIGVTSEKEKGSNFYFLLPV